MKDEADFATCSRHVPVTLRSLVDCAPLGISISSLSRDRLETVNPALCAMLGYTEAELLGLSLSTQIYALPAERDRFLEVLVRNRHIHGYDIMVLHKDGHAMPVRLSGFLVANTRGELDCVQAYIQDLTEQSALEQQVRQVQKLESVGRLAGGVAHDFNNILLVIKLSTEMMLRQVTPDSPLSKPLLQVSKAADRAGALTRQMLAFGRQQVMRTRTVNVNSVVNDISHMLRRIIGEDVVLVTKLADDLANTRLDSDQLGQIVFNLAVNARDAMPDGGVLHIETSNADLDSAYTKGHPPVLPGKYVMMAVTDTGCGIKKETVPRIFDPFFTTKEVGQGSGLGLSIVYGIVKQSGGHIWVYSEPNQGTTFKLYFPATEGKSEPLVKDRPTDARATGQTVLVVEDESAIRSNLGECLQQLGYKTMEAENGYAALEICERFSGKIDLVLTDLVMPGLSGIELVRQLRQKCPVVAMLFMSGYTEDNAARRELLPDRSAFLQKPFSVADLSLAVQRALLSSAENIASTGPPLAAASPN